MVRQEPMEGGFVDPEARRLSTVALCCLPCVLFPVGVAVLSQTFGYDGLASDDDFTVWPSPLTTTASSPAAASILPVSASSPTPSPTRAARTRNFLSTSEAKGHI
jgi:hypothetical protein